jgi:DNA-binding NarL/FixJ family response regulator
MNKLSRIERQAALLVACGMTNKEIANELDISLTAAKNAVWRTYKKLDITHGNFRVKLAIIITNGWNDNKNNCDKNADR